MGNFLSGLFRVIACRLAVHAGARVEFKFLPILPNFGRGWPAFGWLREVRLDFTWERNSIVLWESGAIVPIPFNKASIGDGRHTELIWHELPSS